MKKIELKHLAPYLPYELKMQMDWPNGISKIGELKSVGIHPGTGGENLLTIFVEFEKDNSRQIIFKPKKTNHPPICKPILSPLSDLKSHFDKYRFQIYSDFDYYISCIKIKEMEYAEFEFIFENHFDVFGLIEKGLAIDINTLTSYNFKTN